MKKGIGILLSIFLLFFVTSCATMSQQAKVSTYQNLTIGYKLLTTINVITNNLLIAKKIDTKTATEIVNLTITMRKQLDVASANLIQNKTATAQVILSQVTTAATNLLGTAISILTILINVYPELQSLITDIINEIESTGQVSTESLTQLQEALNSAREADIISENNLIHTIENS